MDHTRSSDQEGEEGNTDGNRSREDGFEEMLCTLNGSMPARYSFSDLLQIAVDDHDRIINNHAQCHNQCSQGYGIQFQPESMEQAQ